MGLISAAIAKYNEKHAFARQLFLPEEEGAKYTTAKWDDGCRWFRSPNVICFGARNPEPNSMFASTRRRRALNTESRMADQIQAKIQTDVVWGACKIAREIGQVTYHLLSRGLLPAQRIGRRWVASRTRLR
jgi:hypothetical protein